MENSSANIPTLEELNSEEAKLYLGGVVFVSILMTIAIVGNSHVLLVYGFRMKSSTHRIFILCLGFLDLTICCIGMPFVLVDLQRPFMFFMVSACKVLRFINYFMCTASAWTLLRTLLLIAVDRYRKICVPLGKQMSVLVAKVMCGVIMGVSLLTSWPAPILYGHATVKTRVKNMTRVRCYTDDKFKDTKYQTYFNAVLILIVFGVFFVLTVLYIIIGRQILKHKTFKTTIKSDVQSGSSEGVKNSTSDTIETPITSDDETNENVRKAKAKSWFKIRLEFKKSIFSPDVKNETKYVVNPKPIGKHTDRSKRTTFMLFMITLVFFCSFVPHLILKIVTFVNPNFVPNMTSAGKVVYNTGVSLLTTWLIR